MTSSTPKIAAVPEEELVGLESFLRDFADWRHWIKLYLNALLYRAENRGQVWSDAEIGEFVRKSNLPVRGGPGGGSLFAMTENVEKQTRVVDFLKLIQDYRRLRGLVPSPDTDERRAFLRRGMERAIEVLREKSSFDLGAAIGTLEGELAVMRVFHEGLEKQEKGS